MTLIQPAFLKLHIWINFFGHGWVSTGRSDLNICLLWWWLNWYQVNGYSECWTLRGKKIYLCYHSKRVLKGDDLDRGLPRWSSGQESSLQCRGRRIDPWSGNYNPTCHGETKPVYHSYWAGDERSLVMQDPTQPNKYIFKGGMTEALPGTCNVCTIRLSGEPEAWRLQTRCPWFCETGSKNLPIIGRWQMDLWLFLECLIWWYLHLNLLFSVRCNWA